MAPAAKKRVSEVIAGRKVAADGETFGLPIPVPAGGFDELRWSLTPAEVERYRDGARRASAAMERACRELRPNNSEHDAAASSISTSTRQA
jgi:Xaa-Pro aminopeptidase